LSPTAKGIVKVDEATPGTLERLVESLVSLRQRLQEMHGNTHRFSRTSASQADAAYEAFGQGDAPSVSEDLAMVFANTAHVRQFQASVFVSSIVIRKLVDAIAEAHKRNDLTSLLGQLRSLVERFGHLHYLLDNVSKGLTSAQNKNAEDPFLSSLVIGLEVKNALYGTTVKWNDIAVKNLEEINLDADLGKKTKKDLGDHFAKQILDKIDSLDESRPGTRAAYEVLCEFLHPNVGDLFASTTDYLDFKDRFGIHHIVRHIVMDEKPHQRSTADRVVLAKIYVHFAQLARLCMDDFEKCIEVDRTLTKYVTDYTRMILKENKGVLRKQDFCLCSSGERIFRCCGQGLMFKK
jgi:hypothetical protein